MESDNQDNPHLKTKYKVSFRCAVLFCLVCPCVLKMERKLFLE